MSNLGKTIQIYLPDGNPRGMKVAEITSRTVQVALVPRANLEMAALRPELSNVGVYFLVGAEDEENLPVVYVGEAEDCLMRLRQHNKAKDFWQVALVCISRTQYFTKAHVKFLEWLLTRQFAGQVDSVSKTPQSRHALTFQSPCRLICGTTLRLCRS
jgi:hypothetical protein